MKMPKVGWALLYVASLFVTSRLATFSFRYNSIEGEHDGLEFLYVSLIFGPVLVSMLLLQVIFWAKRFGLVLVPMWPFLLLLLASILMQAWTAGVPDSYAPFVCVAVLPVVICFLQYRFEKRKTMLEASVAIPPETIPRIMRDSSANEEKCGRVDSGGRPRNLPPDPSHPLE